MEKVEKGVGSKEKGVWSRKWSVRALEWDGGRDQGLGEG